MSNKVSNYTSDELLVKAELAITTVYPSTHGITLDNTVICFRPNLNWANRDLKKLSKFTDSSRLAIIKLSANNGYKNF